MNKKTVYKITACLFLIVELVLYVYFSAVDISTLSGKFIDTTNIKYTSLILCLTFAVVSACFFGRDGVFLSVALFFTAVSDYFILVLDSYYILGVCSFVIVQVVYFTRIHFVNKRKIYLSLLLRVLIFSLIVVGLVVFDGLEILAVVSAFYIVNLVINAVESFTLIKFSRKYILFSVGLCLFVMCDVCVGMYNIGSVLNTDLFDALYDFASIGMWMFYLPSQVMIVLSANEVEKS